MKIFSIIIILLVTISCNKKDEIVETVIATNYESFLYNNKSYMDSLRKVVVQEGKIEDFENLYNICVHSVNTREEVYYTKIMAEKYNYPMAYYYLYISSRYQNSKNMDKLAVYYLLKAYEGNCEEAKYGIGEIFKDKPIPKSEEYLCIQDTTKLVEIPIM